LTTKSVYAPKISLKFILSQQNNNEIKKREYIKPQVLFHEVAEPAPFQRAEKKAENTGNMKTGLRFFSVLNSMQAVLHQPLFSLLNYFNVFTNFKWKICCIQDRSDILF